MRGAGGDGGGKISAHPHAEDGKTIAPAEFGQLVEEGRGVESGGGDAHQADDRQPIIVAAKRQQGANILG